MDKLAKKSFSHFFHTYGMLMVCGCKQLCTVKTFLQVLIKKFDYMLYLTNWNGKLYCFNLHTGLNTLHNISFFTFAASGSTRVSNKAKFSWEVGFQGFVCCFSVRNEKSLKMYCFLHIFGCNFDIFEVLSILTEKQRTKP